VAECLPGSHISGKCGDWRWVPYFIRVHFFQRVLAFGIHYIVAGTSFFFTLRTTCCNQASTQVINCLQILDAQSPRKNDYVGDSDGGSDDEGSLLAAISSPYLAKTKSPPLPPSKDATCHDGFSLDPDDDALIDPLGPREIINEAIKTVEKTNNVSC